MGTWVTSTCDIKCNFRDSVLIKKDIGAELYPLLHCSFDGEWYEENKVLVVKATPRRVAPQDPDEVEWYARLTEKYKGTRIWLHRYVNHGGFEFQDFLISGGTVEKVFRYDFDGYVEYDAQGNTISSGDFIMDDEGTAVFEFSESYPYKTAREEFFKDKEEHR